jgi:hypothetical protein
MISAYTVHILVPVWVNICIGDLHLMPLGNCVLKIGTVEAINEILPIFYFFI